MIDTVLIRNFKSLRQIQVGLQRFTIIVGPNGSGKSSVLQALNSLCRVFHTSQHAEDAEILQAMNRRAKGPIELAVEMKDAVQVRALSRLAKCFRYRSSFTASSQRTEGSRGLEFASSLGDDQWTKWQPDGKAPLPAAVLLHLSVQNLTSTSINNVDGAAMSPSGTGLHSALASIALHDPDTWQELQSDLRVILPTIRRLRHEKVSSNKIPELLFDTVGAESLRAHQMSEGSLLVLGLLTALYASECPNLVLLDDLDRGLHPKAQKDLVSLLRQLLERKPELQIIATTHSPYLLDWMEPNEVLMTCLDDDGSTNCAGITKHPQFEKWKNEMAPGEMWSLFGENWLAQVGAGV